MIIDTHSHCYWDNIEPRIDEVLANMQKLGVSHAVQIGCDIDTSIKAISLAKRFPGVFYATVGFHPETAQDMDTAWLDEAMSELESIINDNREYIVAVGETGFDYHYLVSGREMEQKNNQKVWWLAQWKLAQKYNLPLVIHTRDARDDTANFMIEHNIHKAVIHCYSENYDFAQKLMNFSDGIYFAFWGIVTYKKSDDVQDTAKRIPLDRLLLETDAPFLSPQVVRGTINEPANTRYIFEKICELRPESKEEIEYIIFQNSLKFYQIQNT